MNIQTILLDAYSFFKHNLRQIFALCFPFLLLDAVTGVISIGNEGFEGVSLVVSLAIYPIYTVALILLMARQASQQKPSNSELVTDALKFWGAFLVLTLINYLLSISSVWTLFYVMTRGMPETSPGTASPASWVWMLALAMPALWFFVRISFAEFCLVLNRQRPIEAIKTSFDLTRDHFWTLFGILMITMLFSGSCKLILDFILQDDKGKVVGTLFLSVASLVTLFATVVVFRIYMEVVMDKPHLKPSANITPRSEDPER